MDEAAFKGDAIESLHCDRESLEQKSALASIASACGDAAPQFVQKSSALSVNWAESFKGQWDEGMTA